MATIRETAVNYINNLPEDTLLSILPLLKKLSSDIVYIEKISFDELSDDEKEAVLQGRMEYDNDELIDFEDYLNQR